MKTFVTAQTNEQELIRLWSDEIGDTYANLSRNTVYGDTLLEVKSCDKEGKRRQLYT